MWIDDVDREQRDGPDGLDVLGRGIAHLREERQGRGEGGESVSDSLASRLREESQCVTVWRHDCDIFLRLLRSNECRTKEQNVVQKRQLSTSPHSLHLPGVEIPVREHARRDHGLVAAVAKLAVEQISVVAIAEIFLCSLEPQFVFEGARLEIFAAMCAPMLLVVCAGREQTFQ